MIDEPQLQQPHKFSNGRASKIGFFRGQLGAYRPKTWTFLRRTPDATYRMAVTWPMPLKSFILFYCPCFRQRILILAK